jgi:hypothetical protein
LPDVALLIDWENVYYTLRQHTTGPLPSSLAILQAILKKAAEFGPVRVKLAIFGQEVATQDETLLMALEFTGIEPIPVAQRMSGRLLKGRSDAVRPDIEVWFIVSGDRDLNALCKALKDEDKKVYLVAGDLSLANELRESPHLRDDVFLLEDLIPEARWTTRGGLRADDTQFGKEERRPEEPAAARTRARRGGGGGRAGGRGVRATPPIVPAVVPTGSPESEKEQRRLAVLLLDQLVAIHASSMARGDFVRSVVPLSEKEASSVLEQRIDAAIEQRHIQAKFEGRIRAKAKQLLAPNFGSPLVAETYFHFVRLLRRINTVTKDTKRVPVVEAVLDPLSRADQPGGIARGRTQRRVLLETLFNIAEERGAIQSESVQRDGREITMCWLVDEHPLVVYARQPAAAIAHLFNFVSTTRANGDRADWVNAALFAELLSRVEGDALESNIRSAVERGIMKPEDHGKKAGFVVTRDHSEVRAILGEFGGLDGDAVQRVATSVAGAPESEDDDDPEPIIAAAAANAAATETPLLVPRKRTRRGSRGGRGRGGRGRKKTTAAGTGTGTEAAD